MMNSWGTTGLLAFIFMVQCVMFFYLHLRLNNLESKFHILVFSDKMNKDTEERDDRLSLPELDVKDAEAELDAVDHKAILESDVEESVAEETEVAPKESEEKEHGVEGEVSDSTPPLPLLNIQIVRSGVEDYNQMTMVQLRRLLESREIGHSTGMRKSQLIELLSA